MENFGPLFLTAFLPLFVAMDVIGVLPIFISLVDGLDSKQRRTILLEAILTVAVLGFIFTFLGRRIFDFLGITVADFMIAGGIVLLILSISDLIFPEKSRQRTSGGSIGIVPLGIPLIMGPATLTALIVHVDIVGVPITLAAFAVNLLIALGVFLSAGSIMKVLGRAGTQAVSKVANLFLAAIAVMIIRKGLLQVISTFMAS